MSRQRIARIALYGGTFDPVHDGHISVARALLKLFALDEVLFIPAHVAPHKRNVQTASPFHRHAMLALATQSEPRFRVSTVELDEPQKPYTVETIARLRDELGAQLLFVMGADSWEEITTWREWERLLAMTAHVVVTRPGYELRTDHVSEAAHARIVDLRNGAVGEDAVRAAESARVPRIYFTDAVWMDVSSTEIRRAAIRLNEGETTEGSIQVPPPVAEYIKKYRLYREAHETERTDAGTKRAHD
ncbi:MAG TPA: nicotinate-nucleotide adenylyltransferase [Pyrinomonadaceae bacterium]|nr:nicotinate-nucleotide adenylyltransferase [Pyrinomonadaceae bacterium]